MSNLKSAGVQKASAGTTSGAQKSEKRGRPATGVAMTGSERAEKREKELRAAGGRTLNRVRLGPEASGALNEIAPRYKSEREAIEAAIIGWALIGSRSSRPLDEAATCQKPSGSGSDTGASGIPGLGSKR